MYAGYKATQCHKTEGDDQKEKNYIETVLFACSLFFGRDRNVQEAVF
jgi:hypothetical protein